MVDVTFTLKKKYLYSVRGANVNVAYKKYRTTFASFTLKRRFSFFSYFQ